MNTHLEETPQFSEGNGVSRWFKKIGKRIANWYRSIGMTPRSERLPNIVVRLIYATAHWFGDFAPIVKALIHFIANTFGFLVNFAILGCIVAFSISHTIEFSVYVGAKPGYPSWILTFVFEIGFIYSSILLSRDFKQGNRRSSFYVWAMFSIGLIMILVSNLYGMADNTEGKITAVLIPVLIWLTKGMLGHQFNGGKQLVSDPLTSGQFEEQLASKDEEIRKLEEFIQEQSKQLSSLQQGAKLSGVTTPSGVIFHSASGVNEVSEVHSSGVNQESSEHSSGVNVDTPQGAELVYETYSARSEIKHSATNLNGLQHSAPTVEESEVSTLLSGSGVQSAEQSDTPQEPISSQESGVNEHSTKVEERMNEEQTSTPEVTPQEVTPTPQERVIKEQKVTPQMSTFTPQESITQERKTKKTKTEKVKAHSSKSAETRKQKEITRARNEGIALLMYHELGENELPKRPEIFDRYHEIYDDTLGNDWFPRKGRELLEDFIKEYQAEKKKKDFPKRTALLKKFEKHYEKMGKPELFDEWIKPINDPSFKNMKAAQTPELVEEPKPVVEESKLEVEESTPVAVPVEDRNEVVVEEAQEADVITEEVEVVEEAKEIESIERGVANV